MIQNITNKKERKRIEAIASRLCTEEMAKSGAVVDVLDLGKLASVAQDALASGRTQDGARDAIKEWLVHNSKRPLSTSYAVTDEVRAKIKALPTIADVLDEHTNADGSIGPISLDKIINTKG